MLAHCLEDRGIIAGTGSACSARKADRRIAGALALDDKYAGGILRLSLSEYNTVQEADAVACYRYAERAQSEYLAEPADYAPLLLMPVVFYIISILRTAKRRGLSALG